MKKGRNRSDFHKPDQSLPRSKILRGRRNFERLFEKSTVLKSDTLQLRFRYYQDPSVGCLIGFIAPKKKIKSAVKRNRVKRLLREVYRTNQQYLNDLFSKENFGLHGVFIAQRETDYHQIKEEMIPLLKTLREQLITLLNKQSCKEPGGSSGMKMNTESKQN